MQNIKIEDKHIVEYITDMLMSMKTNSKEVYDARFHHNTPYEKATNIIYNGILSKKQLAKLNNRDLTDKEKKILADESYVNGEDNISLSVVGLHDLSEREFEYNPFISSEIDIIISNELKASRRSTNYGNEFLAKDKIDTSFFRAIDFRLLKYMSDNRIPKEEHISNMMFYYNQLKLIANSLIEKNLDIPLREMSNENITLDVKKLVNVPKLTLK